MACWVWHMRCVQVLRLAQARDRAGVARFLVETRDLVHALKFSTKDWQISRSSCWCRGTELNCRHQPFQGCALPTELPRHRRKVFLSIKLFPANQGNMDCQRSHEIKDCNPFTYCVVRERRKRLHFRIGRIRDPKL